MLAKPAVAGQFYVNRRWLGGTLTNFVTIRPRLRLLKDLQKQSAGGDFELLPNQEAATKEKDLERLERTLGGMRDMMQLPGALFIVDPKREHLAIHEAQASAHSDHRHYRHQLRSRFDRFRHRRERRRDSFGPLDLRRHRRCRDSGQDAR